MAPARSSGFTTPRSSDLGLHRLANAAGLSIDVLPNGAVFAIEHTDGAHSIQINQVLGTPLQGGIGRLLLRLGTREPRVVAITGPDATVAVGGAEDRFVWAGEAGDVRFETTLWLHPAQAVWFWQVALSSRAPVPCDVILVQDLGLGDRGFLMNNEAFASQYTDHHVARHPDIGAVLMSRQNLAQGDLHPWAMHGCLDGTAAFATDALQLFGPGFRDAATIALPFGTDLPSLRLQHECACAILQSRPVALEAGSTQTVRFFGLFEPDHPGASGEADLGRLDLVNRAAADFRPVPIRLEPAVRSLLQDAAPVVARPLAGEALARAFPQRSHEEYGAGEHEDGGHDDRRLLSFFAPDGPHNRHVVLKEKERLVPRRHGTLLRSGSAMLPDEATLCATAWMHGVFAAQLTIGNTSFHKLFSVSRDPYNIVRASGLRILAELDGAWRLLAVPSAFDMGLSDCRWIYRLEDRLVVVEAIASGAEPAMQWRISTEGAPCRFLVFGHLVLGEREFDQTGSVTIDAARKRASFRPDANWLWGQHYPQAVYHLVTPAPGAVEAIGGDELLYSDGIARHGGYVALRTRAVSGFTFAVTGSVQDADEAERLARRYEAGVASPAMLEPAAAHWKHVTRGLRIGGTGAGHADLAAVATTFPWLAHNVMMHLTVPHGLEQYTGAAWGTRDVCQGPVEYLLALEHDAPVKDILRIVFAQQSEADGDWPQWFMLEPYAFIRDQHAHGDVIVWPLKALCDYLEATDDLAFLDEPVAWWHGDGSTGSKHRDPVAAHVERELAAIAERFIPGTHLIRYGNGDWNDSLQPVDPRMRDHMVSSWTAILLYQQAGRYAHVLRRAGRAEAATRLDDFAATIAADVNRHLIRDGTLAGYAVFGDGEPELLLHPGDRRTGIGYSLLPMKRAIIAGLFTPEQTRHHLALIRKHLMFPDGARLMDRPIAYRGGPETIFRRAESAAFFGREIGLMYVHSHLRYGEAMAVLGETDALWEALLLANPVAVTERLAQAAPRQRNCYFSSSDAAFPDRYAASAEWERVKAGRIAVEGGWRIYSSGPGLYANLLIRRAFGLTRRFGQRIAAPALPDALDEVTLEMTIGERREVWHLSRENG